MSAVESLGKYEVRRQLGRGAMGTVYEGFDPVIERIVAIKTVRLPESADDETAEEIARFRREAQAAGRLIHPNIVGVFDYGETADLAYIVMEFVDGPPLKNLLDKNERFPLARIVQIMDDLLAGLQFSHERGVVHRDIKPANLMLTKSGQAKIADFGIARIESSSMTQAGTVLGTPAYMSPEQFMGQVVDARSDIYSSGVLLYQLLTGERPFEGSMSAIMHKALNTEAPLPSQISVTAPRPFDGVVKRAMAKRPEDRYASAAEFLAAIKAAAVAPPPAVEPADDNSEATMVVAPRAAQSASAAAPRQMSAASLAASIAPPANSAGATAGPGARAGRSSAVPIAIGAGIAGLAVAGGLGYYLLTGRSSALSPGQPVTPPAASAPQTTPPLVPPAAPAAPPVATAPLSPMPSTTSAAPEASPTANQAPSVALTPVPPGGQSVPPLALAPSTGQIPPTPQVTAPVSPPSLPTPPPDIGSAIRGEVGAYVERLPCSLFGGGVQDGVVQVTGIGGRSAIDGLRQKLNGMGLPNPPVLRVTQVDPTFCAWEDLLRPLVPSFGGAGAGLSLRLPGDPAWLKQDDYIRPRLTMARFPGEIRVDYLDRQGNVEHLFPQVADPGQRVASNPPRIFQPGETLELGEPGPTNPGWQVAEPFGTDVIIAVASEDALFDRPRPTNVEKAVVYLRDLRRALEAARSRGARLTATAMPLETRPK
jgi:tRNA A-37 threonylcarbamoyl transferase component Bud32